jgi:hypothetical protein
MLQYLSLLGMIHRSIKQQESFDGTSKYTFLINQPGRHWIRLYIYPFVSGSYNMSNASFGVSTLNYAFLSNFSVKASVVKEFSVNVTSKNLVITITVDTILST